MHKPFDSFVIAPVIIVLKDWRDREKQKNEKCRKFFLTFFWENVIIVTVGWSKGYLERWLSWSKAHDWNSCIR